LPYEFAVIHPFWAIDAPRINYFCIRRDTPSDRIAPMERLRSGDPEQIGPWQIVNRLGSGGMGIVYMGTNGTRAAAIKIVRDFLLEDPSSRTRLGREVESLKKVKSKYVAEIVGSDVNASPAWIATNYVDGPSLKTLIDNEGSLKEPQWFDLAAGLMAALAGIHSVGVIHRDVKPSNILMSAQGPRIIDFGISFSSDATALTRTGMVAGTPTWFSPEQFQNVKITNAVDNFAAGTVLYLAATGVSPWGKEDTSVANTMAMILTKEANMSLLTPTQRLIIAPLLEKNPKNRIAAYESAQQIEEVRSSLGIKPESAGSFPGESSSSKNRTKKISLVIALLFLSALAVSFSTGILNLNSSNKEAASPIATSPPKTKWSVSIVGDPVAQKGESTDYSLYLCDQAVIPESLQIKELTNPPATSQPKAKVINGDARCGKEFDTIVLSGKVDFTKDIRKYVLAGTTAAGFLFQYEFSISKDL